MAHRQRSPVLARLAILASVAASVLTSSRVATAQSPPQIVSQPTSRYGLGLGEPTFLIVVVSGDAPMTAVWYENRGPGDTSHPVGGLTCFGACQLYLSAQNGIHAYWARISNPYGQVDSATAIVEVPVPIITTQPQGQTIPSGQAATLSVNAISGFGAVAYQWSSRRRGHRSRLEECASTA
jgi:hypothetical protein